MYTTMSDVWSFGVLLWEVVTFASKPYPELSNWSVCEEVIQGYRMERPGGEP